MIVKWKTSGYQLSKIERVEFVRETEKTLFGLDSRGREKKQNKHSEYAQFHDSWDEAFAFLLNTAERRVAAVRRSLELANSTLGNIKGMRKPADADS